MAGASISATTISCNTGEGSVPTLKLSCTTPWVSTVLPSSTHSCPMSPTISCNTGEGSVPTLKLSCTTPWVSTVLPSSTRSCPMSPKSVTSCPRWILSNTDGWIMLMVEPESTSAIIGIPFASILWYKLPWQSLFKIQVRPRIVVDEVAPRLRTLPYPMS